ncbi:MAG: hypothetical protein ACRDZ5_00690 [Acidimicrobiales bacterium]
MSVSGLVVPRQANMFPTGSLNRVMAPIGAEQRPRVVEALRSSSWSLYRNWAA